MYIKNKHCLQNLNVVIDQQSVITLVVEDFRRQLWNY